MRQNSWLPTAISSLQSQGKQYFFPYFHRYQTAVIAQHCLYGDLIGGVSAHKFLYTIKLIGILDEIHSTSVFTGVLFMA